MDPSTAMMKEEGYSAREVANHKPFQYRKRVRAYNDYTSDLPNRGEKKTKTPLRMYLSIKGPLPARREIVQDMLKRTQIDIEDTASLQLLRLCSIARRREEVRLRALYICWWWRHA